LVLVAIPMLHANPEVRRCARGDKFLYYSTAIS
jgi:hypothetical protein